MKIEITLNADRDDVADLDDLKALELARHRAWNRLETPNTLGHLIHGTAITIDQVKSAGITLTEARRVYQRYADRGRDNSVFLPTDEAKAIVQSIDDALEVLERWKGIFTA